MLEITNGKIIQQGNVFPARLMECIIAACNILRLWSSHSTYPNARPMLQVMLQKSSVR
jgi:hypothetical protein